MDDRSRGAWLIHHSNKLQKVTNQRGFDNLFLAGKCGTLLSSLSETENESKLSSDKVKIIAQASEIDAVFQLPVILKKLEDQRLIDTDSKGNVSVIGVTSASVLKHTNQIFGDSEPSESENAALDISEITSIAPKNRSVIEEYISDTHKLSKDSILDFLNKSEQIGFIDSEAIEQKDKIYFNGNLFRTKDLFKVEKILSTLNALENRSLLEFNELLDIKGCISLSDGQKILGETLFSKLKSIAFFDINTVSNILEEAHFITKPSAFCKYGNPFTEDALDLAKAFVTSLSYGMLQSGSARGKIIFLEALLKKLIEGSWVGPATAIGQDYQLLEYKRVVEIKPSKVKKGQFRMRLLKKDIGQIALQVLEQGNASEEILLNGSKVLAYVSPESNREIFRRRQTVESKSDMIKSLRTLRTGI
jgi:hypothetical protein